MRRTAKSAAGPKHRVSRAYRGRGLNATSQCIVRSNGIALVINKLSGLEHVLGNLFDLDVSFI